jgi:hypothetical protein
VITLINKKTDPGVCCDRTVQFQIMDSNISGRGAGITQVETSVPAFLDGTVPASMAA